MEMTNRVQTKHGYKARTVTLAQECELDLIAEDRFVDPIAKINVLNEHYHNQIVVYLTNGEETYPQYIITAAGDTYPLG